MRVDARSAVDAELQPWKGWVESQLRKVGGGRQERGRSSSAPGSQIIPKLEMAPHIQFAVPRPGALSDPTPGAAANCCWWLGLVMDPPRVQPDGTRVQRGKIDLVRVVAEWVLLVEEGNFKGAPRWRGLRMCF